MKRILTNFENFSQPVGLVGKPDQPVHYVLFSGTTVRVLGIVCISSQPFRVGIVLLFFLISNALRNNLTNFENCSRPAEPVGKSDQPVH